jgi:hypothetical protein
MIRLARVHRAPQISWHRRGQLDFIGAKHRGGKQPDIRLAEEQQMKTLLPGDRWEQGRTWNLCSTLTISLCRRRSQWPQNTSGDRKIMTALAQTPSIPISTAALRIGCNSSSMVRSRTRARFERIREEHCHRDARARRAGQALQFSKGYELFKCKCRGRHVRITPEEK